MPLLTADDVFSYVQLWAAPALDPVLTDNEVRTLVAGALLATVWTPLTAVPYGMVSVPAVRNGHRYLCVTAGTTGATEPGWALAARGGTSDGTVVWQEAGPDSADLYDGRAAVAAAWRLKLAKASDHIRFSSDGQSFMQQEALDNIQKNLKLWLPVGIN